MYFVNSLLILVDATAIIKDIYPWTKMDINTFTKITGVVTNATSDKYTTKWSFDPASTIATNPGKNLTLDPKGPFISNVSLLTVSVDNKFFQLDTKYLFQLSIINSFAGSTYAIHTNLTVHTNSAPKGMYNQLSFYRWSFER